MQRRGEGLAGTTYGVSLPCSAASVVVVAAAVVVVVIIPAHVVAGVRAPALVRDDAEELVVAEELKREGGQSRVFISLRKLHCNFELEFVFPKKNKGG
jgi:hypothetical protein